MNQRIKTLDGTAIQVNGLGLVVPTGLSRMTMMLCSSLVPKVLLLLYPLLQLHVRIIRTIHFHRLLQHTLRSCQMFWSKRCWLLMCNTLSGYASLNYQWWQTLVLVGGLGHKCRRCVGIGNQVSSLEIMGRVIVLDNNDGFLNRNVMLPLCTITQDNLSIIQLRVIDKMLLS